jgi:hypothetical protein
MGEEGVVMETVKDTISGAAMTSPWWVPALHTISETAALIVPVLAGMWFITQIVTRLYVVFWKKK